MSSIGRSCNAVELQSNSSCNHRFTTDATVLRIILRLCILGHHGAIEIGIIIIIIII